MRYTAMAAFGSGFADGALILAQLPGRALPFGDAEPASPKASLAALGRQLLHCSRGSLGP